MVVVGAVPANSVVCVWTGAAVIIIVVVLVATGFPMQEHASARVPFDIDPRTDIAWLALHGGATAAAANVAEGET